MVAPTSFAAANFLFDSDSRPFLSLDTVAELRPLQNQALEQKNFMTHFP
jgi:hypothetical protein